MLWFFEVGHEYVEGDAEDEGLDEACVQPYLLLKYFLEGVEDSERNGDACEIADEVVEVEGLVGYSLAQEIPYYFHVGEKGVWIPVFI